MLGGGQNGAALQCASFGCVRSTLSDGRTEWRFDASSSPELTLLQAVALLPAGISVSKAALRIREDHPNLTSFSTRELREALSAAHQPTVPSASSLKPAQRLAALMAEGAEAGVATGLAAFAKDFVIRRVSGSGLGAYASRDIKRGERLLAEAPLVEWTFAPGEMVATAAIDTLVGDLSQADRDDYFGLCQNDIHGATKTPYGIWLSNAYPTDSALEAARSKLGGVGEPSACDKSGAIFAGACRLNHACTPNSHCAWNARLHKETIHALVDIERGSEITVSYLPDVGTESQGRRTKLHADLDRKSVV